MVHYKNRIYINTCLDGFPIPTHVKFVYKYVGVTLGFQGPSSISAFESDNSVDVTVVLQGKIAIEVDFYLSTVNGSAYGKKAYLEIN